MSKATNHKKSSRFPGVYQNPSSGRWYCLWKDHDGKQRQKGGFPTEKAADNYRSAQRETVRSAKLARSLPGYRETVEQVVLTVDECFERYLTQRSAVTRRRPATIKADRWKYEAQIQPTFGDRSVATVSVDELLTWQSRVVGEVSHDYAKTARRLFSNLMDAAVREGAITTNPFNDPVKGVPKVVKPKTPEPKLKERYLTAEDHQAILDQLPPHHDRYRALLILLWESGLRPSEAYALRSEDFTLDGDRDLVWVSVTRSLTTSGSVKNLNDFTKGGRSDRVLPLPSFMWWVLEDHVANYDTGTGGLLFTGAKGGPINANHLNQKVLRPAAERAGIGGDGANVTAYTYRHSHSSQLQQRTGAPLADVAARLGNSPRTVALRYSHANREADTTLLLGDEPIHAGISLARSSEGVASLEAKRAEKARTG